MNKRNSSAGTNDEQRTTADSVPSASLEQNGLLAADAVIAGMFVKIEHPHKCTCIAAAPAMGEGREWYIGKLDEHLPEYPHETHCLHLKTQYKDVTFLCNEADFRNLLIICRAVIGQPHEDWLKSMVEWSLQKAGSICR